MKYSYRFIFIAIALAVSPGCFESWGTSLGDGAIAGLQGRMDSLNRTHRGIVNTLLDSTAQAVLYHTVDSILKTAGASTNEQLTLIETKLRLTLLHSAKNSWAAGLTACLARLRPDCSVAFPMIFLVGAMRYSAI